MPLQGSQPARFRCLYGDVGLGWNWRGGALAELVIAEVERGLDPVAAGKGGYCFGGWLC